MLILCWGHALNFITFTIKSRKSKNNKCNKDAEAVFGAKVGRQLWEGQSSLVAIWLALIFNSMPF